MCRCGSLWALQAHSAEVPPPSHGRRHGATCHAQGTRTSPHRATHGTHPRKHLGLCWATVSVACVGASTDVSRLAPPCSLPWPVDARTVAVRSQFAVILSTHLPHARDAQLSIRVYDLLIVCGLPQRSCSFSQAPLLWCFQFIMLCDAI